MPTDATGTPTTNLSIPKYDPSVDAPSGLGFNATMDYIDGILHPAGLAAGEALVWSGTGFVRSSTRRINNAGQLLPIITASTLAGGPPVSPNDGDIWIATAVDANGARWAFQYNAGSVATAKWEFIGGSLLTADVDTNQSTASTTAVDLTTAQSITLVRAGDYRVTFGFQGYNSVNTGGLTAQVTKGGTPQMDIGLTPAGINAQLSGNRVHPYSAAANDVLKMQYLVGSGTGNFLSRYFGVLPVRVS